MLILRGVVRALPVGVGAFDVRAAIGALLWRRPFGAIGGSCTISALALRQALALLRGGFGGRLLSSAALLVALSVGALSLRTLFLRALHLIALPLGLLGLCACPLSLFLLRPGELRTFAVGAFRLNAFLLGLLLLHASRLLAFAVGAFRLDPIFLSSRCLRAVTIESLTFDSIALVLRAASGVVRGLFVAVRARLLALLGGRGCALGVLLLDAGTG